LAITSIDQTVKALNLASRSVGFLTLDRFDLCYTTGAEISFD